MRGWHRRGGTIQAGNLDEKPAASYKTTPAERGRPNQAQAISQLKARLDELRKLGRFVGGYSAGKSPKYFMIGDAATTMDLVAKRPFSGGLNSVYVRAVESLRTKEGAGPLDFYRTYLVKTPQPHWPDDHELQELWLPIAQLEFYISGCETVIAVGQRARLYAAHIAAQPPGVDGTASFMKRFKNQVMGLWHVLNEKI